MVVRKMALPAGWYPRHRSEVEDSVASWRAFSSSVAGTPSALAAVAPHAGWVFSGRFASRAVQSLAEADTVAVIGGHLPAFASPLAAYEDGFDTPLGPIEADPELLGALADAFGERFGGVVGKDEDRDNTVEVQLPLVRLRFPAARLLWLRAPNGPAAIELGAALAAAAASTGRRLVCLGSTDLTHYGPSYGFSPKGRGPAAEDWVRGVNDRRFIEALLALDPAEALRRGETDGSACSSGAAAAALSFALSAGASRAELLGYGTSLETRRDESFVGYAALAFY
ncbi:MAG TPA: AmmeMemoRadiSam system protein B [Rectinemataceae bacterium]|nr:AmmeMemoRadiSam system protein B [Rectinemataceae bacterium]